MATFKAQRTAQTAVSRLMSVVVILCAFALLPLPQFASLSMAETAEKECPCEEDGETSEKEVVVSSSARRRPSDRSQSKLIPPYQTAFRRHRVALKSRVLQVTVGHQLANGLCAPLLI